MIPNSHRSRPSSLLKGAALLGAAAVFSKILGTVQKIPLQNLAGDEVFGIYNTVYPFYIFMLVIATAGVPVALSKWVAESRAVGDDAQANRILYWSSSMLFLIGLGFFVFLFIAAPTLAAWIGSSQLIPSIRAVAFALLFAPLMSAIRGYYQGCQEMAPTAVSQVVEQTLRVAVMLMLIVWLLNRQYGIEWVAAGAMFGSTAGAAGGLLVVWGFRLRERRSGSLAGLRGSKPSEASAAERLRGGLVLLRKMAPYALIVSIGAVGMPLLSLVDTFTLPRMLISQQLSASAGMAQFGIFSRGVPLVQLVTMLAASVSVALVPALVAARASTQGQQKTARISESSLRIAWTFGWAASIGLVLLAGPINQLLYADQQGTVAMALLGLSAVFGTVAVVTTCLLQGLGLERLPAIHMLLAAGCKLVLNLALTPIWGIEGAALSAVLAFALAAALNVWVLLSQLSLHLTLRRYVLAPVAALVSMLVVIIMLYIIVAWGWGYSLGQLPHRAAAGIFTVIGIGIGAAVFILTLLACGWADQDELAGWRQRLGLGKSRRI